MFIFPEWLQEYHITDDVFADCYESTLPAQRAWLKKTIAQSYAVNSPEAPQKTWTVNTWRGGFETEISVSPLDWTVLLLDKGSVSAVRILAALSPALAAGIQNILVVFVGDGDIAQSVLTGFELAGQEDVVKLSKSDLAELFCYLKDSSACGAILDLRSAPEGISYDAKFRYWQAPNISSIYCYKDEELPVIEVLNFAHPDIDLIEVNEDTFEDISGEVIVVPAELVGEALNNFKIVLTYGQEGCWIWNNFGSWFFKHESVALAAAE
ncbi:hypothetical protein [Maridesulfovibrio zosterae]|uniref:hypothetical protein n=1 Tax=Maridesulfovibrio zosterae TaxID=82171 RepID=UPI000401D4B7|nr:hypothetical protein [Maridesulfovibrio zosterae]